MFNAGNQSLSEASLSPAVIFKVGSGSSHAKEEKCLGGNVDM